MMLRQTPGRIGAVLNNPAVTWNGAALVANAALVGFSFGSPLTPDAVIWLQPGEKRVLDYITPDDSIYVMSDTASAPVVYEEITAYERANS